MSRTELNPVRAGALCPRMEFLIGQQHVHR